MPYFNTFSMTWGKIVRKIKKGKIIGYPGKLPIYLFGFADIMDVEGYPFTAFYASHHMQSQLPFPVLRSTYKAS